jgi:hypothetical protein
MWLVYFPVSFYYTYLSLKAKSFFFFSATNPSIENGGMFFESKWLIYQQIPAELFPKTILVNPTDNLEQINAAMQAASISFPIIVKPDRGERGWLVKKINNSIELKRYRDSMYITFLIQTYIELPVELSVFYYRHPSASMGTITSVTLKNLLTVTGNGVDSIRVLIGKKDRAFLQLDHLQKNADIDFNNVPEKNKVIPIVPYGNHALGAMFINYNHIISPQLVEIFDNISKHIDGFYFGRYDLRCTSIENLVMCKDISILELNGAGAEPAHIYDPSFSFWKAQRVLASHYKMMFDAAIENHKRGVPFMTYQAFKNVVQLEKKYKKNQVC